MAASSAASTTNTLIPSGQQVSLLSGMTVRYETEGPVAVVTIDRPEVAQRRRRADGR